MKKNKIENPKIVGCYNCSLVPHAVLVERDILDVYGIVSLKICGNKEKYFLNGEYKGETLTIRKIMKKWGRKIRHEFYAYLNICSMMHSETYEYDKKTDTWCLIEQGRGLA